MLLRPPRGLKTATQQPDVVALIVLNWLPVPYEKHTFFTHPLSSLSAIIEILDIRLLDSYFTHGGGLKIYTIYIV